MKLGDRLVIERVGNGWAIHSIGKAAGPGGRLIVAVAMTLEQLIELIREMAPEKEDPF